MSINTQEMICKAFGYKDILTFEEMRESVDKSNKRKMVKAFPKMSKKDENLIFITDENEDCKCLYCGNIHDKGYKSQNGAKHLAKTMVSDTYNEIYSLGSKDNFICEYCGFASISYGSDGANENGKKTPFGLKMLNCLITSDYNKEYKYFNSDDKNELFGILKNPPKPPFVILINSRATVLENVVFTAKPTLSKDWIVVNYGLSNLMINPNEVFECLAEANNLASEFEIEPTSDHIFNRQDDVVFQLKGLRDNDEFMNKIGLFISKYDRDCRLVAKMIQRVYLKDNKPTKKKKVASKEAKVETKKDSLFDF